MSAERLINVGNAIFSDIDKNEYLNELYESIKILFSLIPLKRLITLFFSAFQITSCAFQTSISVFTAYRILIITGMSMLNMVL